MLAVFALAIGGIWFIAKAKDRKRGVLMLAAAAVFFVNVLIWTLPA
jgi:Na+-transporting NADH:ubiquinone oxidoreductase subunit NqrD